MGRSKKRRQPEARWPRRAQLLRLLEEAHVAVHAMAAVGEHCHCEHCRADLLDQADYLAAQVVAVGRALGIEFLSPPPAPPPALPPPLPNDTNIH